MDKLNVTSLCLVVTNSTSSLSPAYHVACLCCQMVVMIRGAAGAAYVMNMPIAMPMLYDMALSGAAPAMPAAAPAAPAAVMPPMPHATIGIAAAIAGVYAFQA